MRTPPRKQCLIDFNGHAWEQIKAGQPWPYVGQPCLCGKATWA